MQVSEEQIELLAKALKESGSVGEEGLPYELEDDETVDFFRGFINGLVLGHQMMLDSDGDGKQLAHLLSLGAAVAAERYLKLKNPDEVLFSEEIADFEN
jgi:hypothetical protein